MRSPDAAPTSPETPGAARRLERGDGFGRYLVLEPLGAGGMGAVYSAYDPELDRRVAVKVLRQGQVGAPALRREAQALARLSHPNVIPVHDVGTRDGEVFIAMDLVEGETLRAWLRAERRPVRAVLERFVQAGRGLAAAHQAGVIHGDFKPENVLVRNDGHVFVTDFGLATLGGAPTPTAAELAGTPPYMAPEQFRGDATDERSDQFSFCVALYEGLYGERPFAAETGAGLATQDALAVEVLQGRVRAAPAGSDVPQWLRRVVLRGLSVAPEERFPGMPELLHALHTDPGARRRRLLLLGGGSLAVAALAVVIARAAPRAPSDPCAGGPARLAGAWDPEVRARLGEAFSATALPGAARARDALERALDGYAGAWTDRYRGTCEATAVRHEQSAELLDLRMECLDRARLAIGALTRALSRGDADVVAHAEQAASDLPDLATCSDTAALRARVPPPAEPWRRALAASVEARLAAADTAVALNRRTEGVLLVLPLVSEARVVGHAPLLARTLATLAMAQRISADQTLASLGEALQTAADARDDALAGFLAVRLLGTLGADKGRAAEALAMRPVVEAAVRRAGRPPRLRSELDRAVAHTLAGEGRFADAQPVAEEALAIDTAVDPDSRFIIADLYLVADQLGSLARFAEARAALDRALALSEKLDGKDAPSAYQIVELMATLEFEQGRNDEALATYQRAYAIARRNVPPGDNSLVNATTNVGIGYNNLGRPLEAIPWFGEVVTARRAVDKDGRELGSALLNLADAEAQAEMWDDSTAHYQESLRLLDAALPPEHPLLKIVLSGFGQMLVERGRPAEAEPYLTRALAIAVKVYGAGHPKVAKAQVDLAAAKLDLRDVAAARSLLAEAIPVLDAKLHDDDKRFQARWFLARVREADGDHRGARALAQEAAEQLARDPGTRRIAEQIERWLAAHP